MYQKPSDLQELRKLTQNNKTIFLAGGTDLIPLIKGGVKNQPEQPEDIMLADIQNVRELHVIEKRESAWFIGAGVTLTELTEAAEFGQIFPAVRQAAKATASLQIRNMGTIGGNLMQDRRCIYFNQSDYWRSNISRCFKTGGCICHQIPKSKDCRALYYSDLSLPLYLYDAEVQIFDGIQSKTISVKELAEEHIRTNGTIRKNPILVEGFILPIPPAALESAFIKISIRSSIDFPTVHFAGSYDKRACKAKIFAGAISDMPVELTETERVIAEHSFRDLDELTITAVDEMKKKARLVKEAGISVKVKKDSFLNIRLLLEALKL